MPPHRKFRPSQVEWLPWHHALPLVLRAREDPVEASVPRRAARPAEEKAGPDRRGTGGGTGRSQRSSASGEIGNSEGPGRTGSGQGRPDRTDGPRGSRTSGRPSGSSSGTGGYRGDRSRSPGGAGSSGGTPGGRRTDGVHRGGGRPTDGSSRPGAKGDERSSRAPVVRKGWGSVARRGASTVREGSGGHGPDEDTPEGRRRARKRSDEFVPERFERTDDRTRTGSTSEKLRPPAHRAVQAPAELPADIANELASAAGPDWNHLRDRITERMAAGIGVYERERYRDASRILKTVVDAVPTAPSARELLGLSQYHQSFWKAALPNLEAFAALTGSVDQHPVRMDCHRALGRPRRVEELYN